MEGNPVDIARAEEIKKAAFKITHAGQLVGTMASVHLGVPFGTVDLSLAPTAEIGDFAERYAR